MTKDIGYKVNIKRVRRLYKVMGLLTSKPSNNEDRQVFPYLQRDIKIEHPNQVWVTDITSIPIQGGFMYLTAIIDRYSRFVVG